MKILVPAAGLLALAFSACSPKPEEVCDCIRQSANDFMLKGERPSEAKLLAPCAEMIAKLKDNEAAKVKVKADYEDVQRALDEKKLLAVNGKTPEFAALNTSLDSVLADYKQDYEAAQYRYLNRPVLITVTALYDEIINTKSGSMASCTPLQGSGAEQPGEAYHTRIKIPAAALSGAPLVASSRTAVFDRKQRQTIEKDKRWMTSWYDTELGVHMGTLGDKLEEYLSGKQIGLLGIIEQEKAGSYETYFDALAAEVRAGNYVLLDERKKTGEPATFYFNKLTAKGELERSGKNGYDLPTFTLKNAVVLKTEDLLPGLLLRK